MAQSTIAFLKLKMLQLLRSIKYFEKNDTSLSKTYRNQKVKPTTHCLAYNPQTITEGAQTSIHVAVSEGVDGVSGKYFEDCKVSHFAMNVCI